MKSIPELIERLPEPFKGELSAANNELGRRVDQHTERMRDMISSFTMKFGWRASVMSQCLADICEAADIGAGIMIASGAGDDVMKAIAGVNAKMVREVSIAMVVMMRDHDSKAGVEVIGREMTDRDREIAEWADRMTDEELSFRQSIKGEAAKIGEVLDRINKAGLL